MNLLYEETMARIKTVSRPQTQTELAKLLEASQSSVAEAKRRQSIPADWYLKLFEKLGVNPDWLKKGNGPVYLRTEAGYVPSDGDGPPIDPGLLGSPLAQSALAPVYAMCGDSTKTASPAAATDRKDRPPQAIRPRRDHRSGNGQRISRPHSALRRLCRHRHSRKQSRKRRTVCGTASL